MYLLLDICWPPHPARISCPLPFFLSLSLFSFSILFLFLRPQSYSSCQPSFPTPHTYQSPVRSINSSPITSSRAAEKALEEIDCEINCASGATHIMQLWSFLPHLLQRYFLIPFSPRNLYLFFFAATSNPPLKRSPDMVDAGCWIPW